MSTLIFFNCLRHFSAFVAIWCLLGSAWSDEIDIRQAWARKYPKSPPLESVTPSPILGLYEIRMATSVFYADAHADFVFEASPDTMYGHLVDTRVKKDLTSHIFLKEFFEQLSKLPERDGIEVVAGPKTNKLVIFEDPDCPYCKQMNQTLLSIPGAEVIVYVIPILGPKSQSDAEAIWCSKDRADAWGRFMKSERVPSTSQKCDTSALKRNSEFAKNFHILATPTLVFPDGSKLMGVVDAKVVEERLAIRN